MRRILLVDDEEVITYCFSQLLQDTDIVIDTAQTAIEAQGLIAKREYSAAIIDLRLSNSLELEGLELIRLLHLTQKHCSIIVITAYEDEASRKEAREFGCYLFFEKPIEPFVIRETLYTLGVYGS